jgi:hypothetical protein
MQDLFVALKNLPALCEQSPAEAYEATRLHLKEARKSLARNQEVLKESLGFARDAVRRLRNPRSRSDQAFWNHSLRFWRNSSHLYRRLTRKDRRRVEVLSEQARLLKQLALACDQLPWLNYQAIRLRDQGAEAYLDYLVRRDRLDAEYDVKRTF